MYRIWPVSFAVLFLGVAMAEDAAVENELLKVEYKAGILSFTSKPGGKTFVPKATFSQTV